MAADDSSRVNQMHARR